jgi:tetratricopeptide (TPR) repeat protein
VTDPHKQSALDRIDELKAQKFDSIFAMLEYADAMRIYEVQFHDGGRFEQATIAAYQHVLDQLQAKPHDNDLLPTSTSLIEQVMLPYSEKSWLGLWCATATALGKTYFMANMFQKSYDAYSLCLKHEGIHRIGDYYLDAHNGRASTSLVLGQYEQAASDYWIVIQHDIQRFFPDAFTGLARILEGNASLPKPGWEDVVPYLQQLVQQYEQLVKQQAAASTEAQKAVLVTGLRRYHHALFTYHDKSTKDTTQAWLHLQESHRYKLSVLQPWQTGYEEIKVQQISQIFQAGFWPDGAGSSTETPIFIIGFPRSGSTLLERVLDAHPDIVGTGENSVFNSRLDDIRNQMVETSMSGNPLELTLLTKKLADQVVDEMHQRWELLQANSEGLEGREPLRLVDKMLTNYFNVGFIHMLYPRALILHVMREPMDTLWSAHKHEFASGALEYTADLTALTEMYRAYRAVMEHWDHVLPGRIKHIRYEDLVNDMSGMARAIIAATGLPWDEDVLDFHKKQHFVNTMSSTQVRKKVYKSGMKAWKRYEAELQPLVHMVGDLVDASHIQTTLPDYRPPIEDHSEL